ncbi:MauE/DoxX family redox-associated membrane protein [Kribbella sp. NPDC023855]|uniref:MauE/DoxX family redox-associated membrane protein n=1 Tax=Kribbella sp. NPDC023855 TaxID=3154698 RepID=UPI0033D46F5B
MKLVHMLVAVTLTVVFTASVVGKVRSRNAFAAFVRSVPAFGVPRRLAGPVALIVTGAEAAVVCLLIWSLVAGGGAVGLWAATALMSVLTVSVVRAVLRADGARCRCFGSEDAVLGWLHVGRNAGLLLMAGGVALAGPGIATADSQSLLVAAPLGGLLALVVVRLEDLAVLVRSSSPA